jgi:hypothetical protein
MHSGVKARDVAAGSQAFSGIDFTFSLERE